MKTVSLCQSDREGGAAIAAHRIHHAVRRVGIDSRLWVDKQVSDDWSVSSHRSLLDRTLVKFRYTAGNGPLDATFRDPAPIPTMRTYNWLPSRWPARLRRENIDLVHLHWYNLEMMSIAEVGRIEGPKIQTIADMWPFCGAEHYTDDDRWREGYTRSGKIPEWRGLDIDRLTWKRKHRHWSRPWQLVAPSRWIADCVQASSLMRHWPVAVIPNALDTEQWKPLDRGFARSMFGLSEQAPLLAFGAVGGTRNPRKGYRLMQESLARLTTVPEDLEIVVFGQSAPRDASLTRFPTHYVGRLQDPVSLCALYSAVDVFVNPATQEAFGQTGAEAQACGVPVVAFEGTGLADIIEHERTGYLARLGDVEDLAHGIEAMLRGNDGSATRGREESRVSLGLAARERAQRLFSYEAVGASYASLYADVVREARATR